jgi:HTH-type transcriptional regulator/antitoxin HipB
MTTVRTAADIGSAIAAARKRRGLTQSKLAALVRTSQGMVSEIETGKETARISIVLRLIEALGLEIDVREPGAPSTAGTAANAPVRPPDNVVFDEPLPDDSIDLDAIVGGSKPARPRR